MIMKEKKDLKLAQIKMKTLFFALIALCAQLTYAQKKVNLLEEDEKIKLILNSNLTPISYPDSIALYSFYIKITPQKSGINRIYISNSLANKVYGNIDSLFSKINFSKFIKGSKQKHVIIPVGIIIYAHQNMKPTSKLNVWELKDIIPKMMADEDPDHYKSVFLNTVFIFTSTKIYN